MQFSPEICQSFATYLFQVFSCRYRLVQGKVLLQEPSRKAQRSYKSTFVAYGTREPCIFSTCVNFPGPDVVNNMVGTSVGR